MEGIKRFLKDKINFLYKGCKFRYAIDKSLIIPLTSLFAS